MDDTESTLATFYRGWHDYQEAVLQALAPLTAEQLALTSAAGERTIGQIATHMAGARGRWANRLMGVGGPEMADMASWDRPGMPVRTAGELAAALRSSWQALSDALARWSPDDMKFTYTGERNGEPYSLTRQWVIWHLIEHDLHHGGEISLSLGMYGLTAPDI